ncbi:hypothetical protein C5167_012096 [Papaver somniferum]|uniref:Neprosin PEP catalytic domain-containing protein n=1 Tax=Papaver somniferum TaxID=3469 RepID=A0A4Y7IZN0_PAPSO|nr:uncharacterized protein LOC113360935 [Papaver somniferum]RZC53250.1 hypothetical protein C5167_012096 [Papaver somniferum]
MLKFINFTLWLIFSILSFGILTYEMVVDETISNANASIIKTVESDNDEIIYCYDVHKQPAFSNPLFRNHPIQMRPSSYPQGVQPKEHKKFELTQIWHKYGLCPEGTVPIRRSGKNYHSDPILSSKHLHPSSSNDVTNTNEFASITPVGDNFQGAQATINIWKPLIEQPQEFSASQIWISADNKEVIETGWDVHKSLYGDELPRIFVHWTADHYNSTGCYNIQCPGFVQTTSKISLGSSFDKISIFHGTQSSADFVMFKDKSTGNWWVQVQGVDVGYWPHFLFKQLSTKATRIDFGGQIANTKPNMRHTKTQMGSGHFPSEGGFGISSYFRRVKVFDGNYEAKVPGTVFMIQSNTNCYGLKLGQTDWSGIIFYYGGPGFSSTCQ